MPKASLRLRVFAGPNGSGKSTVIQAVRDRQFSGKPIDFGVYVNADDIALHLKKKRLSFSDYDIRTDHAEFVSFSLNSGLIGERFTERAFWDAFELKNNHLKLVEPEKYEHLAQVTAHFLREKLLSEKKKFSFETVFSHESKLDIMQRAAASGYKVYLYFVCTEDPLINVYRVKQVRVEQGGHDVPQQKIEERYYRSLELLHRAAQLTHRTFFFDNSGDTYKLFADFQRSGPGKRWNLDGEAVPSWFRTYYSKKTKP